VKLNTKVHKHFSLYIVVVVVVIIISSNSIVIILIVQEKCVKVTKMQHANVTNYRPIGSMMEKMWITVIIL